MQITKANCINLGIMGKFSVGAVYNSDKFKYKYTNTDTQFPWGSSSLEWCAAVRVSTIGKLPAWLVHGNDDDDDVEVDI